jgi:hypothetical protein
VILVLNEVRRHELERACDVCADALLLATTPAADALGLRDHDLVDLSLDLVRVPAGIAFARAILRCAPARIRVLDVLLERRVFARFADHVQHRFGRAQLLQLFQQQGQLLGRDPLRA